MLILLYFGGPYHEACRIEPAPPALETPSVDHWSTMSLDMLMLSDSHDGHRTSSGIWATGDLLTLGLEPHVGPRIGSTPPASVTAGLPTQRRWGGNTHLSAFRPPAAGALLPGSPHTSGGLLAVVARLLPGLPDFLRNINRHF